MDEVSGAVINDKVIEVLRRARDRISKEENWCQGAIAVLGGRPLGGLDATSIAQLLSDPESQFCPFGAIHVEAWYFSTNHREYHRTLSEALCAYESQQSFKSIGEFNDAPGTTHAEVIDVFNRAIVGFARA